MGVSRTKRQEFGLLTFAVVNLPPTKHPTAGNRPPDPRMTRSKRAHLHQHLKHVKYGDPRVRTKDLEISLDKDKISHHICCHYGPIEIKEDFELLSEEVQDMETLAVLRQ